MFKNVNVLSVLKDQKIKLKIKNFIGGNMTFEQMLKFRQTQAKKSILVRVAENYVNDLEKFCTKYVNIEKMFFYNTINDRVSIFCDFYFILVLI